MALSSAYGSTLDIVGLSEKNTPVAGDFIIISDGADGDAFKKVDIANLPGGEGGGSLNALTDVTLAAIADTEILIYDSGTSVFENHPLSGDITMDRDGVVSIGNDKIVTAKVLDDNITYDKVQNVVSDQVLLGNVAGAGSIVAELNKGTVKTLLGFIEDIVEDVSPQLGAALDTNAFSVLWSKGADVIAGSALPVLTDGNSFDVTGATTIDTIDTMGVGTIIMVHFDGAPLITHHSTNLVLPTAANIQAAAGDMAIFQEYGVGTWRMLNYSKADGTALAGAGGLSNVVEDTSPELGGFLDTLSFGILFSKGADVVSGTTLNLGVDGNVFDITGSNQIDGIATEKVGSLAYLQFDGTPQLTHNGTSFILPTGANIAVEVGDAALFTEISAGNWQCLFYMRADGSPVKAIVNADIAAGAAIALSKLATDPLARANHTGTQALSTISDSGALAALATVGTSEIDDDAVTYGKIQNVVSDDVVLGNIGGAGGIVAELTASDLKTLAGYMTDLSDDGTPQLAGPLDTNSFAVRFSQGGDVSSGAALNLGSDGNAFDITGNSPITSILTEGIGTWVALQFNAALTLTHHATNLVLPKGANITTAAGDIAILYEYNTGTWRLMSYQRAGGILGVDLSASAAIAVSQLAVDVLARANHTGTQLLSTISDSGALAALATVGTSEIDDEAVTLAKMQHITTSRVLGRITGGTGDVEELTSANLKTILALVVADLSDAGALATLDTVGTSEMDDDSVTYGKMQNVVSDDRLLGNVAGAGGIVAELDAAAVKTFGGFMTDLSDDTSPSLAGDLVTGANQIQWAIGADVVATAELPVLTDGNSFNVTGATGITGIADIAVGVMIMLHFNSTPTLTHSANLFLSNATSNIVAAIGDYAIFEQTASGPQTWRLVSYQRADGTALVGSGSGINAVLDDTSPELGGFLDTNSFMVQWSRGADVTAASTLPVLTDGNVFSVTGSTAITLIADIKVGTYIVLQFAGAPLLTHDVANLILPGGVNFQTAAGDICMFYQHATADWTMVSFQRTGGLLNADISGSAAIALSKLATDPLDRSNHTNTQLLSTISDSGALAALATVGTSEIDDDAVTYGKIQNVVADDVILGNIAGAGGIVAELTAAQVATLLALSLSDISDSGALAALDTVGTTEIDDDSVTYAKMQNVVADERLLGNIAGAGGIVAELTAAQVKTFGGFMTDLVDDVAPQLGAMLDINGFAIGDGTLELLSFIETASAVNHIEITNAIAGGNPLIAAAGGDTDIKLNLDGKGAEGVQISGVFEFPQVDGAANEVLKTDGSALLAWVDNRRTISFTIDGGGSVLTTGVKGDLNIDFACTIDRGTLLADQDGAVVIDIWKDTFANYPPLVGDSITAAAPLTIAATGDNSQDSTLTDWTLTIAAGDTLRFNVVSVTTIERVTVALRVIPA